MSAVVGVDLSSRFLDLVKLDEDSNRAEWRRVELAGDDAWARTLSVRGPMTIGPGEASWWDDVYLVAIEEPRGRGQLRTNAVLNRVVGAVAASLPARLRVPERCWVVRPDEWRDGLGLKHNAKPTHEDVERMTHYTYSLVSSHPAGSFVKFMTKDTDWQNARDAYCLAYWARDTLAAAAERDNTQPAGSQHKTLAAGGETT